MTTLVYFTFSINTTLAHPSLHFSIVSGMFWVPGGIGAIYSVKHCGLAVGQGVWSSLIVIISFSWGIFFFHEKVRSLPLACLGILIMVCGIWGMSLFSVPEEVANEKEVPLVLDKPLLIDDEERLMGDKPLLIDDEERLMGEGGENNQYKNSPLYKDHKPTDMTEVFGIPCTRRTAGLSAALFNGIWGGSIMVPFQWAPEGTSGLQYLISFAVGAALVTASCLFCLFAYYEFNASKMPSMHFRVMWLPGFTAGVLWSIGNVASILAVQSLGEGVGYSLCQAALLVSGLWGLFYFDEIVGVRQTSLWLLSAVITVAGMILLSCEHVQEEE